MDVPVNPVVPQIHSAPDLSNIAVLGPKKAAVLRQMDITHVCEGLYLSDFESLTTDKITYRGVTNIINAAREVPKFEMSGINLVHLPVYDVPTENIGQHFDMCADLIHKTKLDGSSTLVHCALGISRSVSVCLAYLVKYEKTTLREAYYSLKLKRPIIRPNEGFWRQLISYETEKCGKPTVKMLVYPMGSTPDVYKTVNKGPTNRFQI